MAETPPLVLASSSPRRRELLSGLGVDFDSCAVDLDEAAIARGLDAVAAVTAVAAAKFDAVRDQRLAPASACLITGDTLVVGPTGIVGKPTDADHTRSLLRSYSSKSITVVTALCAGTVDRHTMVTTTNVGIVALTESMIDDYIALDVAADKAGALELQGGAAGFISHVDGCWTNVVGMPLCATAALLGLPVTPVKCHSRHGEPCREWAPAMRNQPQLPDARQISG